MTFVLCVVLLALSACVKQASYPLYPILTTVSMSKTSDLLYVVNGGTDSISVTLAFTDGEGGIGPVPTGTDTTNFVVCNHAYDNTLINDAFYNVYWYTYHAPSISTDSCLGQLQSAYVPDNSQNLSVKGTIQFNVNVSCPPTGTMDTLHYSFFIKDRNGKVSNRVYSPNIYITCQ